MYRSRGTLSAPVKTEDDDDLGEWWVTGYNGSGFRQSAGIVMYQDGAVSGTSIPGGIGFSTTSSGKDWSDSRMIIDSVGRVRIGDFGSGGSALPIDLFDTGEKNSLTLSGINRDFSCVSYGDGDGSKCDLAFFRLQGTPDNPTGVGPSSQLGFVNFQGYYPGGPMNSNNRLVRVGAVMDGNPSATSLPARLELYTTPIGATAGLLRMVIKGNGNVGIGTAWPGYLLDVTGDIRVNGNVYNSDQRWKKNIQGLDSPLEKINQLNGVSFEWKKDEFKEMNFSDGRHIGLIAQDVEKIIPEVVSTDPKGYKSVEYANLVAYLIEAVKEQQKEIIELKNKIDILDKRVGKDQ
jgi:hypothetical protein